MVTVPQVSFVCHEVSALESDAHDVDVGVHQDLIHFFCDVNGFTFAQRSI